jgi:hypothetical protein
MGKVKEETVVLHIFSQQALCQHAFSFDAIFSLPVFVKFVPFPREFMFASRVTRCAVKNSPKCSPTRFCKNRTKSLTVEKRSPEM